MSVKRGEYKGRPVLTFEDGSQYGTTMGCTKLAAVVANIDEAITFLQEHGNGKGQEAIDQFWARVNEMSADSQISGMEGQRP